MKTKLDSFLDEPKDPNAFVLKLLQHCCEAIVEKDIELENEKKNMYHHKLAEYENQLQTKNKLVQGEQAKSKLLLAQLKKENVTYKVYIDFFFVNKKLFFSKTELIAYHEYSKGMFGSFSAKCDSLELELRINKDLSRKFLDELNLTKVKLIKILERLFVIPGILESIP